MDQNPSMFQHPQKQLPTVKDSTDAEKVNELCDALLKETNSYEHQSQDVVSSSYDSFGGSYPSTPRSAVSDSSQSSDLSATQQLLDSLPLEEFFQTGMFYCSRFNLHLALMFSCRIDNQNNHPRILLLLV